MEFTEPFAIPFNSSHEISNISLSPQSDLIAVSEYIPANRRIGSNIQETMPSWSVKLVATDVMSTEQEFHLTLPCGAGSSQKDPIAQGKRPFLAGRRNPGMKRDEMTAELTCTGPEIGPNLKLAWSPNGKFLAAWPMDTAFIFILSTATRGPEILLRIDESVAVGLSGIRWTPDSRGILTALKYGMGVKYWRLDCKNPVHLFPYPRASTAHDIEIIDFSSDGIFMAMLHRRDACDHIAIYSRGSNHQNDGDWSVVHWLKVPENIHLDGICFARGLGEQASHDIKSIPYLYAWESFSKFQFLVYSSDGELCTRVDPSDLLEGIWGEGCQEHLGDFEKNFCTFGIHKWKWCESGRLGVFCDSQEAVYVWNSVNHRLMGQITLQMDALKAQAPIIFHEKPIRDPETEIERVKYEASYSFPLQSQILSPTPKSGETQLNYSLSFDGEFLALQHAGKYPNCLWIFDLRQFRLKAVLVQLSPITAVSWHPRQNLLTLATGSDHVYFWQADGTHCIPYPSPDFSVRSVSWHRNQQTMLLSGPQSFCLGNPEVLSNQ